MNITVDIGADLELRLVQAAAQQGVEPGQFIVNAMRDSLERQTSSATCLDADESRLLEEINRGLSPADWSRYYALVAKRQADALTDQEFEELTSLSNHIEELNSHRMKHAAELARRRGTTLSDLLDQLGIVAPPVI
jgi:hypothetical protein